MARDGRARQPGGLADGHRQAPGHRPVPPQQAARAQARRARPGAGRQAGDRGRGAGGGHRRRRRRRPAAAGVHLLPPGAVARGAGGADPAPAGRAHHRRDRPRLPGPRAHGRPADRPGQADAGRGERPLRGAARARAGGPARLGAGGHLPHLQRGLRRHRRRRLDAAGAVRGRPAAGAHPGRSCRREPEVHGLVALMEIQASRLRARKGPVGRAGAAARPEPGPLGPRPHPPRAGRPGPRRELRRPPRALRPAGGHRRLPRPGPDRGRDRLGADRARSTASSRGSSPRRWWS